MNNYTQYFEIIAQKVDFDIEKYVGQTSITINTKYHVHKTMLEAMNLLNGDHPHLCMPMLNDIALHVMRRNEHDVTDYVAFEELAKFSKWYGQIFVPAFEHAKTLSSIDITSLSSYQAIFDDIHKWFNIKRFSGSEQFVATEYTFAPTIYHTNNIKRWLAYCEHSRLQIAAGSTQCIISTCVRQDKIDDNFSAFYFAFITPAGIWLINDEINFREIHTKLRTRRPERHREQYFETIPLPHAILFDQKKWQNENTSASTLPALLSGDEAEFPVYQFAWSQFDECEVFANEFIKYVLAHQNELFNQSNITTLEFLGDSSQKLIGTGDTIVETKGYMGSAMTYITNDFLKAKNVDVNVETLPLAIGQQMLEEMPLYDRYQLVESSHASQLATYFARETAVQQIREKLRENSQSVQLFEEGKSQLKEIYAKNSHKIINKLFAGKRVNVLQENFKKLSRSFDSDNEKLFVVKRTQQLVYTEKEYREIVEYVFPTMNFSPTKDYGYATENCRCQHCINTNVEKPAVANVHMFARISHYRELMWLFDLERHELPIAFNTYANDYYDLYVGNSITSDVDPAAKIYEYHRKHIDSHVFNQQGHNMILLSFAVCKRCYTKLKKQAPDVFNVEIDYKLLPQELILGGNKEFNTLAKAENDKHPESYNKIYLVEDL